MDVYKFLGVGLHDKIYIAYDLRIFSATQNPLGFLL